MTETYYLPVEAAPALAKKVAELGGTILAFETFDRWVGDLDPKEFGLADGIVLWTRPTNTGPEFVTHRFVCGDGAVLTQGHYTDNNLRAREDYRERVAKGP